MECEPHLNILGLIFILYANLILKLSVRRQMISACSFRHDVGLCLIVKLLQSTSDSTLISSQLTGGMETFKVLASTGVEPATFALLARRSNQLS